MRGDELCNSIVFACSETKERWIRAKYIERAYLKPLDGAMSQSIFSPSLKDQVARRIVDATLTRNVCLLAEVRLGVLLIALIETH